MNLMYIYLSVTVIIVVLSIVAIVLKNKNCSLDLCQCNSNYKHVKINGYTNNANNTIPVGAITIWSGQTTNIPTDWYLCDGDYGTPDLRGKFILGKSNIDNIGDTNGEETHVLTIDELPSHSHTILNAFVGGNLNGYSGGGNSFAQNIAPPQTDPTGNNKPHNNMPPFYVLAYIMKYQ